VAAEEEEEDGDDEDIECRFGPAVMYRHGIYFLAGIYNEGHRVADGRWAVLRNGRLVKLYKVGSQQVLMSQFTISSVSNGMLVRSNPSRVPNRQQRMTDDVMRRLWGKRRRRIMGSS